MRGSKGKVKSSGQSVSSFRREDDEVFEANDCVMVNPETKGAKPYIGKIKDMVKQKKGNEVQVLFQWYYRPEESTGGRKPFHGEKELFQSEHQDWASSQTILQKCSVHTLKAYQKLRHVEDTDYFSRFKYKPSTREFKPDKVPVFCICEMPYNPDKFMVMCDECEEWYHPECIDKDPEEMRYLKRFVCHQCKQAVQEDAKRQRVERIVSSQTSGATFAQEPC